MAIEFNAAADLGEATGPGELIANYTVGSGNDRLLVMGIVGAYQVDGEALVVTYAGIPMLPGPSEVFPFSDPAYQSRNMYFFYLLNPPSGSNEVSITGGIVDDAIRPVAADYSGVRQDVGPSVTAVSFAPAADALSMDLTIETVMANSWVIIATNFFQYADPVAQGPAPHVIREWGHLWFQPFLSDSGQGLIPGSYTFGMTTTNTSDPGEQGGVMLAVAFDAAPVPVVFPPSPNLGDTVTDADTGAVWLWDGVKWGHAAVEPPPPPGPIPVPIVFNYTGAPGDGAIITVPIVAPVTIPLNMENSNGYAGTPPTAAVVFTLSHFGGDIGTVTAQPDGAFVFASTVAVDLGEWDVLRLTAPSPPDAAMSNVGITVLAGRAP